MLNEDYPLSTTGTAKWFNATKGYGFIQPDDGGPDAFVHISAVERAGLDSLRDAYARFFPRLLAGRWLLGGVALVVVALGAVCAASLGREFFPAADAGLMRLYLRAPAGTRLEDTARLFAEIQRDIRSVLPAAELQFIGESIGVHPAILTVVLIAMGYIYGLLGIILAAPVSAIGRDLFLYTYRRLEGLSPAAARRTISQEGQRPPEYSKQTA